MITLVVVGIFIVVTYNEQIKAINQEMSRSDLRGQPSTLTQQTANFEGQDEVFAAQTGLAAADYRSRAVAAEKLDFSVHEFKSQSPDSYAGTWIDQNGNAFIAVTDKNLIDLSPEGVTYVLVERSEAQLIELLGKTRDWIVSTPDVQSVASAIAIDPQKNDVVVYVGDGVDDVKVPTWLANVRIELLTVNNSNDRHASVPLSAQTNSGMGGDGYGVVTKAGSWQKQVVCSTGFNGTSTDGKTIVFTSAYCQALMANNAQTPAAPVKSFANGTLGTNFGSFVANGRAENNDYSVLAVNDAIADRYTTASVRSSASPLKVTGVAIPIVGMPVCKSGVETGVSCGYITTAHAIVPLGIDSASPWANWTDSFLTSACASAGDSGGSLMSGTKAVGMMTSMQYGDECHSKQGASVYSKKASAAYPVDTLIQKVSDSYQLNIAE